MKSITALALEEMIRQSKVFYKNKGLMLYRLSKHLTKEPQSLLIRMRFSKTKRKKVHVMNTEC